jgi:hypothetical protein
MTMLLHARIQKGMKDTRRICGGENVKRRAEFFRLMVTDSKKSADF